MKYCKNEITAFVSSNVAESETLWLVTDLYNTGDERRDGHYVYAYAGLDGTNSALSPSNEPTKWLQQRPTNYWAMLDGRTNTQTTRADNITVGISTKNYDTFSLLEVEAPSVILTLTVDAVVVWTNAYALKDESAVIDFYTYCFSDFIYKPSLYVDSIPLYGTGTLKVEIINTGSTAKCGRLVYGRSSYVGKTLYTANLGLESYSVKQTDIFGTETLIHRGAVNLDSYKVNILTSQIELLRRKAIEYDAIPLLFIMDESNTTNTGHLLNYGYYQNMSVLLSNPRNSTISLTVKGIL